MFLVYFCETFSSNFPGVYIHQGNGNLNEKADITHPQVLASM